MNHTIELLRSELAARRIELDASYTFNLIETECVYCCVVNTSPGGCHAPDKVPPKIT